MAPASCLPTMRSLEAPQPSLLGIPIELRNAICYLALEDFVVECRADRAGLLPYKAPGLLMVAKSFYRGYISMFYSLAIFADTYGSSGCIKRMQRLRRLRPDLAALITRARVQTSKLREDDDNCYELDVYFDQCRAIDLQAAYSREFRACKFEVCVLGPDGEQIWTDSPWKACFDSPDGRPEVMSHIAKNGSRFIEFEHQELSECWNWSWMAHPDCDCGCPRKAAEQ